MRRAHAGFSLIEVLVAIAILGVGAALTLSLISGSLGKIRKVQLRARAVQHAETVMEISLLDYSIKGPTTLNGDFEDGTRWTLMVSEFEMPSERRLQPNYKEPPVKVLAYAVEVRSPESQTADFRLDSLKLVGVLQTPGGPALPGQPIVPGPPGLPPGIGR